MTREEAIELLEQEPCEDAISRQAVEKITWEEPSYTDALNALTEVREKVRALPPVTPKLKTGQWIVLNDRYNNCSECGFHYDTWNNRTEGLPRIFDYCPICGAKMDESQESEGENGRYRISN